MSAHEIFFFFFLSFKVISNCSGNLLESGSLLSKALEDWDRRKKTHTNTLSNTGISVVSCLTCYWGTMDHIIFPWNLTPWSSHKGCGVFCHWPCSSPALRDVKPHLHHAALTCDQRSCRHPACCSQRSTRANSDSVRRFPCGDRATKINPVWRWPSVWHLLITGCKYWNFVCGQSLHKNKLSFVQWVNLFLRACFDLSICVSSSAHICPLVHDWGAVRLNARVCVQAYRQREGERERSIVQMPAVVYVYSLQHHYSRGYTGHERCFIY